MGWKFLCVAVAGRRVGLKLSLYDTKRSNGNLGITRCGLGLGENSDR